MANERTFTVAGTTVRHGKCKFRTANSVMYTKVLLRDGHEQITLVELGQPMTKLEAALFVQEIDLFQTPERAEAIREFIERESGKAAPAVAKAAAAPVAAAVTPVTDVVSAEAMEEGLTPEQVIAAIEELEKRDAALAQAAADDADADAADESIDDAAVADVVDHIDDLDGEFDDIVDLEAEGVVVDFDEAPY